MKKRSSTNAPTTSVDSAGKGSKTRQRVIERAAPILNTKGFAGTALSDLMAATGLKKGGIYRHFASKQQLALASLRYTLASAEEVKFHGIDDTAEGIDQLLTFIQNFIGRRSPIGGGCPILNTSVDQDDGIPVSRAAASKAQEWIARLASMAQRSQRAGAMTDKIPPEQIAWSILSTLEGALALQRLIPDAPALQNAGTFLVNWLETLRVSPT